MKMLNNLKKNNKGFTLIEIIIVIVIIAILAVMLIPAMIEWIDSANERTFLSACDSIETAVLSTAAENYATEGEFGIIEGAKDWEYVSGLVGATLSTGDDGDYKVALDIDGKEIESFIISNEKYKGRYEADGGWTVVGIDEEFPTVAGGEED